MEPKLADEFKAARFLSWAGKQVGSPLAMLVGAQFGLPPVLVEMPVRAILGEKFSTLPVRAAADILAAFRSADNNYRSCCCSALCYAVTGSHEWAFGALRVAASKHDGWARHHHIYGLIHGVDGNHDRALFELGKAGQAEPHHEVRMRVAEAEKKCRIGLTADSRPEQSRKLALTPLQSWFPESVGLLVELLADTIRRRENVHDG